MIRGFLVVLLLLAIPSPTRSETLYAVTSGWNLVWFDSETPGTLAGSVPITGDLETYLAVTIEFDPLTQDLYAFAYPDCPITCPASPVHPAHIDLATGESSLLDWPGFPSNQLSLIDFDIDPATREIRLVQPSLANDRYSLPDSVLHVDESLDTPGTYVALAHPPPAGAHGGETLAIVYPLGSSSGPHLARIGGVGGIPPASSGQVTMLGSIDIPHYVSGFDISPGGTAYLLAHPDGGGEARLFRLNLETLTTEDLGTIATPALGQSFVYAIAAAPTGPAVGVVEVPALSPAGLAASAILLALVAVRRARQRAGWGPV